MNINSPSTSYGVSSSLPSTPISTGSELSSHTHLSSRHARSEALVGLMTPTLRKRKIRFRWIPSGTLGFVCLWTLISLSWFERAQRSLPIEGDVVAAAESGCQTSWFPAPPSKNMNIKHDKQLKQQEYVLRQAYERRQRRRAITRPPKSTKPFPKSKVEVLGWWEDEPQIIQLQNETVNWKKLCAQASLSKSSRLLLYAGLSQSIGVPLSLLVAEQCHVAKIVVIDPLLPNTWLYRMNYLQSYRILKRAIPKINLVVPLVGISVEKDWLDRFQPTHVIHLDLGQSLSFLNMTSQPPWMDDAEFASWTGTCARTETTYLQQSTLLTTDQLLQSQARYLHVTKSISVPQSILMETHKKILDHPSLHRLLLGKDYELVGPFVRGALAEGLKVENVLAAILQVFGHSHGTVTFKIGGSKEAKSNEGMNDTTMDQLSFIDDELYVYGDMDWSNSTLHNESAFPAPIISPYHKTYGIHKSKLPCASRCAPDFDCVSSAFDERVIQATREASRCRYVIYSTNFSSDLREGFNSTDTGETLCRVFFVSRESPLVRDTIAEQTGWPFSVKIPAEQYDRWNGKLNVSGWKLVWLPDDSSQIDKLLPKLDPGKLFSTNVRKAMYTTNERFARATDVTILKFISVVDRPASKEKIDTSRCVERVIPAANARKIIFFAGRWANPPRSVTDFLNLKPNASSLPVNQLEYYAQAEQFVQDTRFRDDIDSAEDRRMFQWVSTRTLVHDFATTAAQQFRCQWLDEQLYWGHGAAGSEELSLAYTIGQMHMKGGLGMPVDPTGAFLPLLQNQERVRIEENVELFMMLPMQR